MERLQSSPIPWLGLAQVLETLGSVNNWPSAVQQIWTDSNTEHQNTTETLKQDPARQNAIAEINLI